MHFGPMRGAGRDYQLARTEQERRILETVARWMDGSDLPSCPAHGTDIAPAEAECLCCDCRWLLDTGSAESPVQTALDLAELLRDGPGR